MQPRIHDVVLPTTSRRDPASVPGDEPRVSLVRRCPSGGWFTDVTHRCSRRARLVIQWSGAAAGDEVDLESLLRQVLAERQHLELGPATDESSQQECQAEASIGPPLRRTMMPGANSRKGVEADSRGGPRSLASLQHLVPLDGPGDALAEGHLHLVADDGASQ